MGGTQRFASRAGVARAKEFVFTGDLYDAATLERWNVVNRVVPDDELQEKGMRFAGRLANGPTVAHEATKRIVMIVFQSNPPDGVPADEDDADDAAISDEAEEEDVSPGSGSRSLVLRTISLSALAMTLPVRMSTASPFTV